MSITTPAFFRFPFAWNAFYPPLSFSLYVSLGLKWVSCRQHIYGSCVCIHSASLTLFFFFNFWVYLFIYLFIYLWLCWVFVSVRGLHLVAASGGHSSLWCMGLSLSWPLLLWSTGSRCAGSVTVAHRPSCSMACGIFPDQGSNPCPLHWQADSQPLRHQGNPICRLFDDGHSDWCVQRSFKTSSVLQRYLKKT